MARDLQSLQLRQLQHENQIIEEKKKRDSHLAILEEELKLVKERDEYIRKHKKSHPSRVRSSDSHAEEENLRISEYYQPTLRRTRRDSPQTETRVDLPYFYGKENFKLYLDYKMKVE